VIFCRIAAHDQNAIADTDICPAIGHCPTSKRHYAVTKHHYYAVTKHHFDNEKKEVVGEQVTPEWLRKNHGVAIWPMSWYRYKKHNADEPNKVWPPTDTKLIEFKWDWKEGDKRRGRYSKYNALIEKASGEAPYGLKRIGFDKRSSQ